MKKFLFTIILSIVSFNMIHADVTWKLSNDGTLTISGTNMPDYYSSYSSKAPWLSQKDKIKKVVINNGVTNIGGGAFYECSNLTSISIPKSVKSIEIRAFWECGLTSVTLPNSVTSIEASAFSGCTALTSVTIPNSVTSIGKSAFLGCSSLTSVAIPNSVTSIGYDAFNGCAKLTSVTLSNSVTTIEEDTFYGCKSLTSVTIPNSVTTIEDFAFAFCEKITSVTIPNSVTKIGNSVFWGCDALTSVTNLAKTPQKIGDKTFQKYGTLHVVSGCKAAYKAADYWNNFTIVEDAKDMNSNKITWKLSENGTLTIYGTDMPDYYRPKGTDAPWFSQRSIIKKVVINNGVTNIGSGAFYKCYNLTSISIPNSVKSIGVFAFGACTDLTSVTIPNSVTSIGKKAFYSSGLTSVAIPNSVTNIDKAAFANCLKLTSVTIPNSVTAVKDSTFYNCTKLTSVTIPNSVTSIGNSVFEECKALTSVTNLAKTPQKIGDKTFTKYGTLHVLPGCKAAYKAADYWKNFTIIEDANGSGTTGVADVEADNGMKDGKYLINGKVVIVRNGKKYNLNGIAE